MKKLMIFELLFLILFGLAQACAPSPGAPSSSPTPAPPVSASLPSTAAPSAASVPTTFLTPAPTESPKEVIKDVILSTTTSTQDSGLLDLLIPVFEKQTGYRVKTIAVGSGQAIAMGQRGEADVLLVHSPAAELQFMTTGAGINRRLVMHNDFIIIGPSSDPAGIKGESSAARALEKIFQAKAVFLSRGDESGTHALEKSLWKNASLDTSSQSWYQQSGQGMGATLNIASEKGAYTISDRATFLSSSRNIGLQILVEGDKSLLNIYHVIQIDPAKFPRVNGAGGKAFADFMVSPEAQDLIGKFGVEKYGQPLFFPDAGKPE